MLPFGFHHPGQQQHSPPGVPLFPRHNSKTGMCKAFSIKVVVDPSIFQGKISYLLVYMCVQNFSIQQSAQYKNMQQSKEFTTDTMFVSGTLIFNSPILYNHKLNFNCLCWDSNEEFVHYYYSIHSTNSWRTKGKSWYLIICCFWKLV